MITTILLVDDHEILRAGLRALLEADGSLQVVGEAGDGRMAVRLARELNPDIVILDVGMPEMNGVVACERILAQTDTTKILALSMHSDRRFVTQMLDAGASGYLLKDCALEELAFAIRTLRENRVYISPGVAETVVARYIKGADKSGGVGGLTSREREVLQLIAEGHSTAEAAKRLHLSVKTIETHRHHIMKKLGLHNVAELTKFAIREGLTDLE